MSLFKTSIPIDIGAIKDLLPPHHTIDKVTFNKDTNEVELHWHARYAQTPYTFPVDWPVKLLKKKQLPDGVKDVTPKITSSKPSDRSDED